MDEVEEVNVKKRQWGLKENVLMSIAKKGQFARTKVSGLPWDSNHHSYSLTGSLYIQVFNGGIERNPEAGIKGT